MRQRAQAALPGLSHHAHARTPPLHAAKNLACSSNLEAQSRHCGTAIIVLAFCLARALCLSVTDIRHHQALILANKLQLLQQRPAGTCPEVPLTPSQNNSCTPPPFPSASSQRQLARTSEIQSRERPSDQIVKRGEHVASTNGDPAEGTGLAGGGERGSGSGTALLVSQNVQLISGLVASLDSVASTNDLAVHMHHLVDSCHKMQLLVQRACTKAKGLSAPPIPLPAPPSRFLIFSHCAPPVSRAWPT